MAKTPASDLPGAFHALRALLQPLAPRLVLRTDTPDCYWLDTDYAMPNGQSLFFASAQIKKQYVSYYLMPVYVQPALLDGLSPALRARMQGKSCFNFKHPDAALLQELGALTQAGWQSYQEQGFVGA